MVRRGLAITSLSIVLATVACDDAPSGDSDAGVDQGVDASDDTTAGDTGLPDGGTDVLSDSGGDVADAPITNPLEPVPVGPDAPFSPTDLDEDGIPDQLELEGFMWDSTAREFRRWNLDVEVRRYFTDPNQESTDGDPFSDSMEITGINMPLTVLSPGDDPLVPALPRVIAVLDSYSVETLQAITLESGEQISSNQSWGSETTEGSSRTQETSDTVSGSVTVGASVGGSLLGPEVEASVSVEVGLSHTEAESFSTSSSTAYSVGGGIAESREWSRATTVDSGAAATLSLVVSVRNDGNAPAANIVPTFTLSIGGKVVQTFDPEITINRLDPGASFPSFEAADITLTMTELALLESGAPIVLEVPQTAMSVSQQIDGQFDVSEPWSAIVPEIQAVSARVRLDDGDGGTNDFLIYARNAETSPVIRLRDAIVGGALGREEGGDLTASVFTADRTERRVSLEGWTMLLDAETHALFSEYASDPGFQIMSIPLTPDSVVTLFPGYDSGGTRIHYAFFSSEGDLVVAATDVAFAASALTVTAQTEGSSEYTLEIGEDGLFRTTEPPDVPRWGGVMVVEARNPLAIEEGTQGATLEIPSGQVLDEGEGELYVSGVDPFGDPQDPPYYPTTAFDPITGRDNIPFTELGGAQGVCSNQGSTVGGEDCSIFGCIDSPGLCPCDLDGDEVCAAIVSTCETRLPSYRTTSEGIFIRGDRDPFNAMSAEVRGYYDDYEAERIVMCLLDYGDAGPPEDLHDINPDHPAFEACTWLPLTDFAPDVYGSAIDACIGGGGGDACPNNNSICNGNRDNSVPLLGGLDFFDEICGPADYVFRSPPPDTRPEGIPVFRMTVMRFAELPHCHPVDDGTELSADYEYIIYDLTQFAR